MQTDLQIFRQTDRQMEGRKYRKTDTHINRRTDAFL
jgi:hypothetical protein